jgi:hypothetical protein
MRRYDEADDGPPLAGALGLSLAVGRWRRATEHRPPPIFGVLAKPPERVIHAPLGRGVRTDLATASGMHAAWLELPSAEPEHPEPSRMTQAADRGPTPLPELPFPSLTAELARVPARDARSTPPDRGQGNAVDPTPTPSRIVPLASLAPSKGAESSSSARALDVRMPRAHVELPIGLGIQPSIASSPAAPASAPASAAQREPTLSGRPSMPNGHSSKPNPRRPTATQTAPASLADLTRAALLGTPLPQSTSRSVGTGTGTGTADRSAPAGTSSLPAGSPPLLPSLPVMPLTMDAAADTHAMSVQPIASRWIDAPERMLEGVARERSFPGPARLGGSANRSPSTRASAPSKTTGMRSDALPSVGNGIVDSFSPLRHAPAIQPAEGLSSPLPSQLSVDPLANALVTPGPSPVPLPAPSPSVDRATVDALNQRIEQVRTELTAQRDELSEAIRRQPRGLDPNDDEAVRRLLERVEAIRDANRFRSGRI